MNRVSFSNPQYQLAFGVDDNLGKFFTIYGPEVAGKRRIFANFSTRYGLDFYDPEEQITPSSFIMNLTAPFFDPDGKTLAEEQVVGLAEALGLHSKELERTVCQLWEQSRLH